MSITPGSFYETRDGRSAFVLEVYSIPWAYNGQRREAYYWRGVIEGKPHTWELDGRTSPVSVRLRDCGLVELLDAETDLVRALSPCEEV